MVMVIKTRSASHELSVMRSLNARMDLLSDDRKRFLKQEKGYQGEVMFDQLTAKLQNDLFIINDLCLEFNNSFFQIDTLIGSQDTIYPFEVKNFEGDYLYESDKLLTVAGQEVQNPLDQLKRSKTLLHQLLRSLGFQLRIVGNVVFINPAFTLYQAPLNVPFIFPTQLDYFMKKLDQNPSKLNNRQLKLGEKLISMHQIKSPYTRFPSYEYQQQKKGIICSICFSFMIPYGENKVFCGKCGSQESTDAAILRSVEELKLLFPDIKITTNLVSEWCRVIESKKKIRRILKENYKIIGVRQWTYFE
jgi:hypothetical protein